MGAFLNEEKYADFKNIELIFGGLIRITVLRPLPLRKRKLVNDVEIGGNKTKN